MKAFIPAAGLGTRLRPFTDCIPKALVNIAGKPMLEWLMIRLIKAGIDEVVVNLHHYPGQLRDFFQRNQNFGIRVEFSDESEQLLDTGGGLWKASRYFDDNKPFLVHNADVLSDVDIPALFATHANSGALATLVVQDRSASRQLHWDEEGCLIGWENTATGEQKIVRPEYWPGRSAAFSGIHIIDPLIFNLYRREGVFSLIEAYLSLAKQHCIASTPFDGSCWLDLGKSENLAPAAEFIGRMHNLQR